MLFQVNTISLRTFFENESEQRKALEAARQDGWLDPHTNAVLYNLSRCAFDPTAKPDDAYRQFEQIYDELREHWQVFRSRSTEPPWPPKKIFETIRKEFVEFPRGGTFSLKNIPEESLLKPHLVAMRWIKPNRGYPSMAVSKFLHFYNPSLFPIYDEQWMWRKVCNGHFRKDYREYGDLVEKRKWNNGEDDETFIPFYMRWASSLIRDAHPTFMQVFAEWFDEQCGIKISDRTFDADTLYATAFEFIAIGAAATQR